jgi:Na+-transporting NADH:ubiquinone oxidoreductase subunit C
MRHSVLYTLLFSAVLCVLCAILVSASAVSLKDRQETNKVLDRKVNVLQAAGLVEPGAVVAPAEVERLFESVHPTLIELATGHEVEGGDAVHFDQQKAKKNPATSSAAPPNPSRIIRVPDEALVYKVLDDSGALASVVLPIEGYGLWGTLYGYLALAGDADTVVGITFYDHKETPGLGGEVDNPRWKRLWPGRKVYDDGGEAVLRVIKGSAGSPAEHPHQVDGLSGATITSRGVTNMIDFWLGPNGFGPYLESLRQERSAA